MVITISFTLGSVEDILATPTGYPFIAVFYNVTGSLTGASVMTAIIIVTLVSASIAQLATASRQTWSFARDGGIPGSGFISRVQHKLNSPLNAVMVTQIVVTLLALINIGSSIALNAVLSLCTVAAQSGYMICIGCVLLKRLRGEPLPPRRWSLGRYGTVCNVLALIFLFPAYIFCFFPPATPVVPSTMNWAALMYGAVIFLATIYYVVHGKKSYVPPVALVKRELS